MSITEKPIGILGGTFDPIHHGHLRIALELYQRFAWQAIRFIPCQQPVLKTAAQATAAQRVAMLRLAIGQQKGFIIDEREIKRATPSYTIDTLISLRTDFPKHPLCLILGFDAFAELALWKRWQELCEYAHLVVIPRPEGNLPTTGAIAQLLQQRLIQDHYLLQQQLAGHIYLAELTPLAISATQIRQQIADSFSPRYLLPDAVWDYIRAERLYGHRE